MIIIDIYEKRWSSCSIRFLFDGTSDDNDDDDDGVEVVVDDTDF